MFLRDYQDSYNLIFQMLSRTFGFVHRDSSAGCDVTHRNSFRRKILRKNSSEVIFSTYSFTLVRVQFISLQIPCLVLTVEKIAPCLNYWKIARLDLSIFMSFRFVSCISSTLLFKKQPIFCFTVCVKKNIICLVSLLHFSIFFLLIEVCKIIYCAEESIKLLRI